VVELKELRNSRWEKAFSDTDRGSSKESTKEAADRKATIVIEHLIQVRAGIRFSIKHVPHAACYRHPMYPTQCNIGTQGVS
jgi:hypothetical protein